MKSFSKIIFAVLMTLCSGFLFAQQKLNMHIDYNRFLDKNNETVLHVDYQIPYRNLVFLAHKGGFFAEVEISIKITEQDTILLTRTVTDNVGVSNKDDTGSNKSYLNRLSFRLVNDKYSFTFLAKDLNSKRVFVWNFDMGK
ncbi:MAG: hypothetical protein Q8J62_10085, partial [Candidatus Cloacimonadaceae bacterium]|nr:hypothetical protein [Candidatus Cloacimonadaceae bacterium]